MQSTQDWRGLYTNLEQQGHVPNATDAVIDSNNAVFRSMCVDLGDLKSKISDSDFNPTHVTVFADVLTIPDGASWVLASSALVIIARRVECAGSSKVMLDYRQSDTASLVFFADEVAGNINVLAVTPGSATPASFTIDSSFKSIGIQIHLVSGTAQSTPLSRAQGFPLSPTASFTTALSNSFIFGSLLYDSDSALALSVFNWVKNWSAESLDLIGIYLRSSSLAALLTSQLNAKANGAAFVPYLSSTIYTKLAQSYSDQARQYEANYINLSTQKVLTDEGIQFAKALRDNAQSNSAYIAALKVQAEGNYNNAIAALNAATYNFKSQQTASEMVAIDFRDVGLPEYEREQIIKAIFDLGTALVTFTVAIGAMLVGQEEAAPAAAAGAVQGAEAVAAAAKTASTIAKLAKDLADAMKTIKKLVEAAKSVYEFASAVVTASSQIQNAGSFVAKMQALDFNSDGVDLTASDQWEIFRLKAEAVLESPVEKGIGYASEYRQSLQILAIYGQSVTSAQVAAVEAGQRYAQVLLQVELAQQQQDRLNALVGSLQAGEQPIAEMMQAFYMRYLDVKSSMYAALQGYRSSYFYWALAPSSVNPAIVDPVTDLSSGLQDLTAIALDQSTALSRFDPPPVAMTDKSYTVTEPNVLSGIRTGKSATWALPADDAAFLGLDRVRLGTVRVWLEGVRTAKPLQKISVRISTSGSYRDRLDGTPFQFTSRPLTRPFEYHVEPAASHQPSPAWKFANGDFGFIEIDGRVDDEVRYAYFQPTPFSTWTITVDPANNPGIDLSQVTGITMQFQGSAVGSSVQ
jgi:hypothetical protein